MDTPPTSSYMNEDITTEDNTEIMRGLSSLNSWSFDLLDRQKEIKAGEKELKARETALNIRKSNLARLEKEHTSAELWTDKKQKTILLLRHKLQKSFLSREQWPQAEDMPEANQYLTQLETFPDLETAIIKTTTINKVLKGIIKLPDIPREDDFKFKSRCKELLEKWAPAIRTDAEDN